MQPTWTVIAVLDPDGNGSDFAYTVGLANHGHPELHVWARPDSGTDPGADFALSPRDLAGLLNAWAGELLGGRLAPGHTRHLHLDAGATRADFAAGEPVPAATVDAHQARHDATVIPMSWSLHRAPIGPLVPLTPAQLAASDARAASLGTLTATAAPPEVATQLSAAGAAAGPRARAVIAAAAALVVSPADALVSLVAATLDPDAALTTHEVLGLARAHARPVGLVDALDACDTLAGSVLDHIAGPGLDAPGWDTLVTRLAGALPPDEHTHASRAVALLILHATAGLLSAEALGLLPAPEATTHAAPDDPAGPLRATVSRWWDALASQ